MAWSSLRVNLEKVKQSPGHHLRPSKSWVDRVLSSTNPLSSSTINTWVGATFSTSEADLPVSELGVGHFTRSASELQFEDLFRVCHVSTMMIDIGTTSQ